MADSLPQAYQPVPMPNSPAGGATPESRMAALAAGPYKELVPILQSHGFDPNDAAKTNQLIETLRKNNNQQLANAVENSFNNVALGRDLPLSIFQLPSYKNAGAGR